MAEQARMRSLDGWRGIGAMVVAYGHLEASGYALRSGLLDTAHVLVDFFFVASGFLIANTYGASLRDGGSATRFAIKRFGRIWPLHAVMLAAFVAVEAAKWSAIGVFGFTPHYTPFDGSRPADMILPNLFMLHSFGLGTAATWNFPSWSVAAEYWTYLMFAGLALLTVGAEGVIWRRVMAAALALVGGTALVLWSPRGIDATWDWGFVRCFYGFFVGVLAQSLWASGRLKVPTGTAAEVVAATMAILFVWVGGRSATAFLAPFVFAPLTLIFAADRGRLSALLSSRPLQALGHWSYSIYLVHAFVLTCIIPRIGVALHDHFGRDPHLTSWTVTALYLTLVVGLSALTFRFVEIPGQRLFARLADHLTGRPARRPLPSVAAASGA